ncbi:hypothetical protein CEXT_477551 [Caerostris extrusa]|uniref:Uncharacterized protein n=1 Tax=Caerostris extrusa TaxID=172846 RepID=A0AAV4VN96_CAEEX|nr:hypothetical protein CEXT_477551 [Caerostris extrusa]
MISALLVCCRLQSGKFVERSFVRKMSTPANQSVSGRLNQSRNAEQRAWQWLKEKRAERWFHMENTRS